MNNSGSYVIAHFAKPVEPNIVAKRLAAECPFFSILGDWHDYRIQQAVDILKSKGRDASIPNVVIESIMGARERHGKALHVALQLTPSLSITGSLYGSGLLLSARSIDLALVETSEQIKGLRLAIESLIPGTDLRCG